MDSVNISPNIDAKEKDIEADNTDNRKNVNKVEAVDSTCNTPKD